MFNLKKSLILSSIITSVFLFLFSCSVGLGESVDTEVPKVEITYPPASSAVRDWFYLAGNCSDDKGVDSIIVSATNTTTNEEFSLGTVTPEKDGTWQIKINEKDSEGNYKLKDGTYTFSVIAIDSSKQKSAANYRTFGIDNTPPVFVIKNPGTTKSESPAPFGSILKIVGAAADEHEIYELELKVYTSADMSGEPKATLVENNVDKTDGINVTLARYNPDVSLGTASADELHNNYLKVYDVEGGGDQQLYASVTLKDSAGVWQNPLHTSADSIGNSTSGGLYLNDDIYNELMGKNSKYGLSASDFMKIINGTYTVSSSNSENSTLENNRAAETDSSKITDDAIQNILEILTQKKTETSATPLSFKLNKDANPTYEVMGFAFNDSEAETFASHKAAKKSSLTFKAQAGLDGTYIKPSTLKVYMFGPYSSCSVEQLNEIRTEPESYYNSAVEKAKEQLKAGGNANPSEELVEATANVRILADYSENSSSSTETFTETIELPSTITKGSFYVLAASGKDIDGLSLLTQNNYGFVGESAGTPPAIVIDGFTDGAMTNVLGNIKVSGTLKSEETELSGVTYSVVVFDETNAKDVATITGEADFNFKDSKLSADWNIADFSKGNKNYVNGYSSFEPKDGEKFKYSVTVSGKDRTGLESKGTKSFTVDMKKPEIKINDITPVAKKTEESGSAKYTVNGTVKFSAVVTDTNLQNVVATVSDGKTTKTLFEGNSSTIEVAIDTTELEDNSTLTFKVVATDNAGNVSEDSKNDVFVNQETDKPIISFTNGKTSAELGDGWTNVTNGQNVFGIDNNNSANFTITDDDGIASVKVTVFDESGNKIDCSESNGYQLQPQSDVDGAKAENPVEYEVGGATTYAVSYKLPKKAGKYKIQLDVLDTGYASASETNKKWHTTTTESYVLVSEGNISISFVDIVNNTCQVNANNNAEIKGTVNVSSLEKLASIERFESTKETSKGSDGNDVETWKKAAVASAKYPYTEDEQDATKKIEAKEDNGKISWTDTIPSAKIEDGVQHFFYQATDIAGNSAEIELICNGDGNAPEIKIDSEVYKKYENWVNSSSVKLSVIAADVKGYNPSGIKKVSYSYGDNSPVELSRGENCDEDGTLNNGNGKYYKYSTTIDLGETSGTTITFTAEDNVGNKMPLAPLVYKVDTTAPKVENLSVAESQVLKNTDSIKVTYSASDALSGVESVEFSTNSNMASAKPVEKAAGTDDYELTGLNDGEYTIYVRVTDKAGNKSENYNTGSFIVDSTAPKVTVTSPVSGSTVNKTISLSGTVVDNNLTKNKTPVLQYLDGSDWKALDFKSSNLEGQNWTISGIDTTKLNNSTDSKEFEFKVLFTDDAGNANESVNNASSYKLTIDQNTDRPEIKLTNIKISDSITSSSEIMGVISDDDGDYDNLKLYRINKADYESNKSANATPSTSGNSWKEISVENGTGIWRTKLDENESQGKKEWYFYVIDSREGTFCTAGTSQINRPYLSDSSTSKVDDTTGISFTFDNKAPEVSLKISHDGTNWEDTNSIFGVNSSVYVKASVKEEVGMKSVSLSVGGNELQSITENPAPIENVYEYLFSKVELSAYKDIASLSISVTAEDSAGQTNKDMRNITVDSKAPSVKIVSPTTSSSDIVSSAVSIKGTVLDDYSSIETLKYAIPFRTKTSETEQEWKNVGTSAAWEIRFASGAQESSESLIYYAVAKDSNGYLYDIKQTGTEDVYEVPIWFYVKDSAGNEAYIKDQYVLVDSESGKPKAWINSPADGTTTSGVVTVYGGAVDNVTVKEVQVQIDADNDGKFTLDDKKYINDSWNDEKDGLKAKLSSSASDTDETWYILANGTNSWKLDIDSSCIKEVSKSQTLRIRVRAIDDDGLYRDWTKPIEITIDGEKPVIKNIKLVQYGKDIEPTDSSKPITEREYISGMYISNISVAESGKWYLTADVSDNEKVDSIKFTRNDSLSENNIYFEDESEKHPDAKDYKLRVPLKTDETGVISYRITATDNGGASFDSSVTINIDNTPPSLYDINNRETVNPGENLRLKSMLKILGTGSENSTVVNNNKYFSFGDYVQEGGSGLAYIAFYFERQGKNGENRIYNPMFGNAAGSNKTVLSAKPANPSNGNVYINSDGLAAMYVTDSSRSSVDSISISAENPNVRKGGLIKIAGSYSLITDVSGTTVKFSPSAEISFTEAEIIFAQVVDHKITESVDDSGNLLNDDGDKMIESIEQLGASYTWSANIDSTNIPDGPIIIHVVAIDNAGNISNGSISTKVENNRPRIAKVLLGTDLNENGRYDWDASEAPVTTGNSKNDTPNEKSFGEFSYFSALNSASGKAQSVVTLDSSKFKVITGLCIVPEFVGGNNGLGYILENPSDLVNATYKSGNVSEMTSKEAIISKVNKKGYYAIDDQISAFGGVEIPSLTSGNISITFWDKTEETEQGTDSQWALLKIPVELMNEEQEAPVPTITPFYWNGKDDNSIYFEDGIAKGHIELESDLPADRFNESSGIYDRDPKVSGKIKIEGSVIDNVRIESIDMGFGKISSKTLAVYEKGEWKKENLPDGIEDVTVTDEYISQEGHKVNYVIVINSEKVADIAGADKEISISAKDWKGNEGAGDIYRIDVVPYITQVWTDLSEYERTYASMNNRASTGEYPVRVGEKITLYGWNLNHFTRNVSIGSYSSGISTEIVYKNNNSDVIRNTDFGLQFELPSVASGEVNVSVNNVPALNNINNDDSHGTAKEISASTDAQKAIADYSNYYNRLPNGQNNNILNDNLKFDVWDFKTAVTPEGDSAEFVHMKVGPYMANNAEKSGRIGFSFKNGVGYFNMPGYAYGTSGTVTGKVDLYVSTSLTQYGAIRIWDENGDGYYYADSNGMPKAQSGSNGDYYVYSFSNVYFGSHKMGIILASSAGSWTGQTGNIWITKPGLYKIETSDKTSRTLTPDISAGYELRDSSDPILYSHTKLGSAYQGFTYNTFAFDKNGETYGTALNSDTSGSDGMGGNLQFFSRSEGKVFGNFQDLNANYYNNLYARRIENIFAYKNSTLKSDQKRTQSLSMATYTDSSEKTYVYNAYYDHLLGQITFRLGSVNGKGYGNANDIGLGLQDLLGKTDSPYSGVVSSDSGYESNKISKSTLRTSTDSTYKGNVSAEPAYKYVSKISGITGTAGYVAVGALQSSDSGRAVIVWYDDGNRTLKMTSVSLSEILSGINGKSWSEKTISTKGGQYVQIAIDSEDGIHLAYMSNSGADLYYAYMPSYDSSTVTEILVDSKNDVGDNCSIDVGREDESSPWIPVITYKSNEGTKTKIAYPVVFENGKPKDGATSGGFFTGNWSVSMLPTENKSTNDQISVGLNKDWSNGVIHEFSKGTDDTSSYTPKGPYAICSSGILYGNGTKNPVVGYAISSGSIEMAQKK